MFVLSVVPYQQLSTINSSLTIQHQHVSSTHMTRSYHLRRLDPDMSDIGQTSDVRHCHKMSEMSSYLLKIL